MIKNNFGESLVGIVIGVFILSFIILGVTNLLINSKATVDEYENKKIINVLKNNTESIISKIDTSSINESENFYLYKDTALKQFKIYTGALNVAYKYVDQYGNKIADVNTYKGFMFTRILTVERNDSSLGVKHNIININIKRYINNN